MKITPNYVTKRGYSMCDPGAEIVGETALHAASCLR